MANTMLRIAATMLRPPFWKKKTCGKKVKLLCQKTTESRRLKTLKIIQQLRDEAHRFGITCHRKKRDKGTLVTELELIPGIGKTTAEKLLKYFKSVKKIREATEVELQEIVNLKQAKAIKEYFSIKP